MARDLKKRILTFVIAYLIMSAILSYYFREDSLNSINETIESNGKKVNIKVFFSENEEIWAQETLALASGTIESLIKGYDKNSPHNTISIYASSLDKTNNYPFKLEYSSDRLTIAKDYPINPVVWGVSQMWLKDGNTRLPDWIIYGQSTYISYWALDDAGFSQDAYLFKEMLATNAKGFEDIFALDEYVLPKNADEKEVDYLFYKSFQVFESLYQQTSLATMASITKDVMSSQNTKWDTARYISFVNEHADIDVEAIFSPVFLGDVSHKISTWKLYHYLELAGAALVVLLIFMWAFWNKIKQRLSFLAILKERNPIKRELIKTYRTKERILMELESYFKMRIPEDQFDLFAKRFYYEKHEKNQGQ